MKAKKTLISLLCASMIVFNANSASADPRVTNVSNVSLIKQIKPITYNFDEFFQEKFQPQNTIEDLISYTYSKYNHIVKKVKISYPGITLEDIIKNAKPWDKIRFGFLLCFNYSWNLNRLGYNLENVATEGDKLKLSFLDKERMGNKNKLPYLKMDIDVSSLPDSMDVNGIKKFLKGDSSYILKTENGKFFYSILRYGKS